jgi:hypothetical protein
VASFQAGVWHLYEKMIEDALKVLTDLYEAKCHCAEK